MNGAEDRVGNIVSSVANCGNVPSTLCSLKSNKLKIPGNSVPFSVHCFKQISIIDSLTYLLWYE